MISFYVFRYYVTKIENNFYLKSDDGKEQYLLMAKDWENAEQEANNMKLQLKDKHKNQIIVID